MSRHTRLLILLIALLAAACNPAAPDQAQTAPTPTTVPQSVAADESDATFDSTAVQDIDLSAYPVMPVVTDRARAIFEAGRADRHNPRVFSKVGDCMTAAPAFLTPFGAAGYDLGQYPELQPVLDYFGGIPARSEGFTEDSFANPGLAAASGFNAASVLDPMWADPNWCQSNESPLACEYRVSRPGIAIIMFGTNDVYYLDAGLFDANLRQVVQETIDNNVIPVLSTFPGRPDYPEESLLFNQIIISVAEEYDLPLINLWLALDALPNRGVNMDETIHLTVPTDQNTGILDAEHLEAGYTYRNLITLQALDVLREDLGLTAG